jgi:hypothetical protein
MKELHRVLRANRILQAMSAGVVATILAISTPMAALASSDDYSWESCDWGYKEGTSNQITWKYDPNYPLPGNVTHDGVLNSFTNRVTDAASRWNAALSLYTPIRLVYVPPWGGAANVVIKYRNYGMEIYGATQIYATNLCDLHSTAQSDIVGADINIIVRNEWFT